MCCIWQKTACSRDNNESSDRADKMTRSGIIMLMQTNRDRERRIGKSLPLHLMELLDVWLRCLPLSFFPPCPNCNTIFLHFWLQVPGLDLSRVPFYHLTVVLSLPFRLKWSLYLRCCQFTCLHLVRVICKEKAKCQDSERGGNFSAQISFHLWYQSTSFTRAKWDFRKEIFERALKLKHGNTKARSWLCNSLRHTQKKVHIWV